MSAIAKLFSDHVLNKSDEKVDFTNEEYQEKVIGLYFSASWCPPCQKFTPKLIEFYKKHAEENDLEIIYLGADEDEESFNTYYKKMPWLKLDFHQTKLREKIEQKFEVDGIPTLILINGDSGEVLCSDATEKIGDTDPEGEDFPWKE